jgi:hypothetical protein
VIAGNAFAYLIKQPDVGLSIMQVQNCTHAATGTTFLPKQPSPDVQSPLTPPEMALQFNSVYAPLYGQRAESERRINSIH